MNEDGSEFGLEKKELIELLVSEVFVRVGFLYFFHVQVFYLILETSFLVCAGG